MTPRIKMPGNVVEITAKSRWSEVAGKNLPICRFELFCRRNALEMSFSFPRRFADDVSFGSLYKTIIFGRRRSPTKRRNSHRAQVISSVHEQNQHIFGHFVVKSPWYRQSVREFVLDWEKFGIFVCFWIFSSPCLNV